MARSISIHRARQLRRDATIEERILWGRLRNRQLMGARFRRQVPIGAFIVDFVCLEHRLILELDGAQHGEPEQAEHDILRTQWLEQQGFLVVRFWNRDIRRALDDVLTTIEGHLHQAKS